MSLQVARKSGNALLSAIDIRKAFRKACDSARKSLPGQLAGLFRHPVQRDAGDFPELEVPVASFGAPVWAARGCAGGGVSDPAGRVLVD